MSYNTLTSMAAKIESSVSLSGSRVCVGLDPDPQKMAVSGIFEFNRAIIDATRDLVAAYKPQFAFYEAQGISGMMALERTIRYIRDVAPHAFLIGDAKRGDIDSTAEAYAKAMFDVWGFDAVTVNAYQGADSLSPFLEYEGRGIFVCCRTSNPSSRQIQDIWDDERGEKVYESVARISVELGDGGNVGLVAGATFPDELRDLRDKYPDVPFLVPGVGAQGGDAGEIARLVRNDFLINSSRGIIYASSNRSDFGLAARRAVVELREEMMRGSERLQLLEV